ncbi:MAG: hypothetical protein QG572_1146 [Pseudomonadota bacterium]|nr:hypothetical protein [Pseudomonadota bacterium]
MENDVYSAGPVDANVRPLPGQWVAPSTEAAHAMGANGGESVEAERAAFEAWMRGHCWALCATWNGREYRSNVEQGGKVCPHAMRTRQLWAAWRDRAALANTGRWA